MKNIVGQPPRGKDFFPRAKVIDKIYRRVDAGAHLFLAAPRRVGKTSIMRFLEDEPQDGYHFIYIITESVNGSEEFYQKLLEELLKSEAVSKLIRSKENLNTWIKGVLNRIESIKFPWLEVNLDASERESFQSSFARLIQEYEDAEDTLVIMIDEFPQTIENIKTAQSEQEAINFLRLQREQRQHSGSKVRFLYTGSIGLPSVVRKLTSTSVINDLNVVEIPPLTKREAGQLTQKILHNYRIPYEENMIDALLEEVNWLIPFHLQLLVQELIEVYENTEKTLTAEAIPKAVDQLLNIRNDIYFEHYLSRLRSIFKRKSYPFVLALLGELSEKNILSEQEVERIARSHQVEKDRGAILEALEYDGYLYLETNSKNYRFNSYLLQKWWNKKNPK